MRVAIVDEELPYPLNSGKRIRTFQLVSRLARRHRISYICHRNADPHEAREAEEVFRTLGIETVVVNRAVPPKSGPAFLARLAANLFSTLPYSVETHTSPALAMAIRNYADAHDVDLWQAEWTPYAESLRGLQSARRLIVAHNVESQIWRRYFENEANVMRRWYIGHQWRKYERFERRVFQDVDRIVAVSSDDAAIIRDCFGARHVEVVENGVDVARIQPSSSDRIAGQVLLLASLDWRPNLDAVDQLLSVVFPSVVAEMPTARLCIVGRNPPAALRRRVANLEGVELHANVPDVRPFLTRSAVMVVPLRIGGGSRLKILEAFAAGLPVISTRIGAEGLNVQDATHLTIVERVEDMAAKIVDFLGNPANAPHRVNRARQLVEDEYDWEILANRLEQIWEDTASHECNWTSSSDSGSSRPLSSQNR